MGMMFSYNLGQCSDWRNCHLDSEPEELYWDRYGYGQWPPSRPITEEEPGHWHLKKPEGEDWIYKTRWACLKKLQLEVNENYDRLYDGEGNHRAS